MLRMERGRGRRLLSAAAFVGVVAVVGGALGCDTVGVGDCSCTLEFRSFSATVVDSLGAVVTDADIAVTRVRDGFTYTVSQDLGNSGNGVYVLLDDNATSEVREGGDAVRVVASKGGASVEGLYMFGTDECACHVEQISGPDTLVLGGAS